MAIITNIRTIRRRIRSVQNTAKITKAMQMVAASKMRRAQQRVIASRPYAGKLAEILSDIKNTLDDEDLQNPLLLTRQAKTMMVIHITPDRGLCGGLNSNLNKSVGNFVVGQDLPVSMIAVGKKGRDFMVRSGVSVVAEFTGVGEQPTYDSILPIGKLAMDSYVSGSSDKVFISFSEFVNTTLQRPLMRQLLPLEIPDVEPSSTGQYFYEPNVISVLDDLVPRYIETQIYQGLLEAVASEHSARMVAMQNATDNAKDMIEELKLVMNKVRQETITKELLEVVGGVAALN